MKLPPEQARAMWGQPPSAVRASDSSPVACSFSDSRVGTDACSLASKSQSADCSDTTIENQRSFAPRTAGGGCPHIESYAAGFLPSAAPHLQCDDKQHFVTFCTDHRWILPEHVRSIVLES